MNLSPQEQELKELGQEAKSFLSSKLYQALSQHLSSKLEEEYPKPNKKGWEEQYRYAKAYETAAAEIVKYIHSLTSAHESMIEKENDETNFNEA